MLAFYTDSSNKNLILANLLAYSKQSRLSGSFVSYPNSLLIAISPAPKLDQKINLSNLNKNFKHLDMSVSEALFSNVAATVIGGLILTIILSEKNHWKEFLSDFRLSIMISLSLLSNEIKTFLLSGSFISIFNPVSKISMTWTVRFSYAICGAIIVIGLLLGVNHFVTFLLGGSIVVAVEVPYRMLMSNLKIATR